MVITAEHIASTIKKIGNLCNELRDSNSSALPFVDRLNGVILVSELYDIAGKLNEQREENLSSYFGENSLRQNLQNVILVEDMQNELKDVAFQLLEEDADSYALKIAKSYSADYLSCKLPILDRIWGADRICETSSKYRFKKIFREAHEDLTEPQKVANLSENPVDADYNISISKNMLEHRMAFKLDKSIMADANDNFVQSLSKIYDVVNKYSAKDVINELLRALEMLRAVLMRDAQDIHYIRTGNFTEILTKENQHDIEHYYTELPLHDYFTMRDDVREFIQDTIDMDIEAWRIKNGYTSRKLLQKEYLDFLNEQEEDIRIQMKNGYPILWEIREHSGGLNEDVTPENFARMFFRRRDVDAQFLELQWKHELILELIKKAELQQPNEKIEYSPKEAAVKQLIDNTNTLAQMLYEVWNGQKVQTGVHQPEVVVIIKAKELANYLEDMRVNHFEELLNWCYPSTANNKQNYVRFVAFLRDKGYFGKLPNNLIAPQLAPIVLLAAGTVTNYLSLKD